MIFFFFLQNNNNHLRFQFNLLGVRSVNSVFHRKKKQLKVQLMCPDV